MQGVGTAEDIDRGMKLGTNQPMGPLQLADFIGTDACNPSSLWILLNYGAACYWPRHHKMCDLCACQSLCRRAADERACAHTLEACMLLLDTLSHILMVPNMWL